MSRFNETDVDTCTLMFKDNRTTKEVQDYLVDKYQLNSRSLTSNFVRSIRKKMGIYHKVPKK
jgi:hypothetical protein